VFVRLFSRPGLAGSAGKGKEGSALYVYHSLELRLN
jgi:hypothetical protein